MKILNEYYELPANRINMVSHTDIVECVDTVVWSLDKQYFICKSKVGIKTSGAMTPFKVLSHNEALELTNSDKYQLGTAIYLSI